MPNHGAAVVIAAKRGYCVSVQDRIFSLSKAWLWRLGLVVLTCDGALAQGPAQIHGVILDRLGKGITGVHLSAEMMWDPAGKRNVSFSRTTGSKARGEFELHNLPAGIYRICPSVTGSDYLPTCVWSDQVPTVSLAAGQVLMGLRLTLQQGQRVHIRIDDPSNQLKAKDVPGIANGLEKRKLANVVAGVMSKRGFLSAKLAVEDVGGESYIVAVPRNQPIRVSVKGTNVEFDYERSGKKEDLKEGNDNVEQVTLRDADGPREIRLTAKAPTRK
jgi:hypothetical protein